MFAVYANLNLSEHIKSFRNLGKRMTVFDSNDIELSIINTELHRTYDTTIQEVITEEYNTILVNFGLKLYNILGINFGIKQGN